jgi:hypothetical protein
MKRLFAIIVGCAAMTYLVMTPATASTDPKARALVPNSGYAVTGDGQTPAGASTEYRNFDGQNNPTLASWVFDSKVDWQAGRTFHLSITSNRSSVAYPPITYTCVTGAENNQTKGGTYYGAELYITSNLQGGNLQCYNAAHSAGYFVYLTNASSCLTKSNSPSTDPRFVGGTHWTIDGPGCAAEVSIRSGNKVTEIQNGSGKTAQPVIFNFPIHIEFDTL